MLLLLLNFAQAAPVDAEGVRPTGSGNGIFTEPMVLEKAGSDKINPTGGGNGIFTEPIVLEKVGSDQMKPTGDGNGI